MNEQSREQQLVSAARDGDMDAFEALVHLYEKRVFALTLRMCGNPEDAAEAAQEAFLAAWQGLAFFRGEASFCLLYTSPSPRDSTSSRMPSSA